MRDAGIVGRDDHVFELHQGVIRRRRLLDEHVEAGAGDKLVLQGADEIVLLVRASSRRVDVVGGPLHRFELVVAQQVSRRLVEGRMRGYVVGPGQQLVQLDLSRALGCDLLRG